MYYVMTCEGMFPAVPMDEEPEPPGPPWITGSLVDDWNIPPEFLYRVDRKRKGPLKPYYDAPAIPLMRDDLRGALVKAGVDNIQFFSAVVEDPRDGSRHENYSAFNILGLVGAADGELSRIQKGGQLRLLETDLAGLTIDPRSAQGLLFFRLAENASAVVVHESVRKMIDSSGIPGMTFYGPDEWSG